MPIINNKKEFVSAVGYIVETDMGVVDDLFPRMQFHTKEEIVYDAAVVEGVAPEYNSFAETANVVTKDGKDRVSLKPVNFNDGISKETIDADVEQFGQNEYGDGIIDPEMESALNGVGKLHLNAKVGIKKITYEALTTHQIANGYIGKNGKENIVFNVPAANKEIFDGTVKKYWSNVAEATPVTDIQRAIDAMFIKPTKVIMNDVTYSNFYQNEQVRTADNSSAGTKKNFTVNENVSTEAKYYNVGRLMLDNGKSIDIMIENEQRFDGASYSPFMPTEYVVYASPLGEKHYGGIPVADASGIRRIAAEFDVQEIITQNPPQHMLQYRTAPLPVLKQGEAYYSQKVEA